MPEKLSPRQINDFKESAVWVELVSRGKRELGMALNKAIDEGDTFAAGRYRGIEMFLNWPDQLLAESEKKSNSWR